MQTNTHTFYAAHITAGIMDCTALPSEYQKGNKSVRAFTGNYADWESARKELSKKARNSSMRFTWINHLSMLWVNRQ